MDELATVGWMARRFGVQLHQVEYVIRSRGIPAHSRAGSALVYDAKAVEQVERELRRIGSVRDSTQ